MLNVLLCRERSASPKMGGTAATQRKSCSNADTGIFFVPKTPQVLWTLRLDPLHIAEKCRDELRHSRVNGHRAF